MATAANRNKTSTVKNKQKFDAITMYACCHAAIGRRDEPLKCTECSLFFHKECICPGKELAPPSCESGGEASWCCPSCNAKRPKEVKSDNTPVKHSKSSDMNLCYVNTKPQGEQQNNLMDKDEAQLLPQVSHTNVVEMCTRAEMLKFSEDLRITRTSMEAFRQDMLEIKQIMQGYSTRLEALETKVETLAGVAAEGTIEREEELRGQITKLTTELNSRHQELLANDIDVSNIPEEKGENTIHLVTLVAATLGVTLDERDIVSAERVGIKRDPKSATESAEVRPRPIVVRLVRHAIKANLLKNARVRRDATTANFGLSGNPNVFYVNERLTKSNRQLFRLARSAAKLHGWKYVWTGHGKIYARQKHGSPAHRIHEEEDIGRIIVPNPVLPETLHETN